MIPGERPGLGDAGGTRVAPSLLLRPRLPAIILDDRTSRTGSTRMPGTEQFGAGNPGDAGPSPLPPKNNLPVRVLLLVLLVPLLLIAAAIGFASYSWNQADDLPESDTFQLDLARLSQELATDREGTKRKYLGHMIEFEVREVTVESRDPRQVVLLLPAEDKGTPASAFGLEIKGRFPFANPRNSMLKETPSGPLHVKVRGAVTRIEHGEAPNSVYTITLDPAWVGRIE
jgi:hypothetical protein